jgi:hypothetical protein
VARQQHYRPPLAQLHRGGEYGGVLCGRCPTIAERIEEVAPLVILWRQHSLPGKHARQVRLKRRLGVIPGRGTVVAQDLGPRRALPACGALHSAPVPEVGHGTDSPRQGIEFATLPQMAILTG